MRENGAKNVLRVIEPEVMLYCKKFNNLKSRTTRFNDYCGEREQETTNRPFREGIRAFYIKPQKVDYEQLREIIEKHLTTIEAVYESDTRAAEERTKEISAKIDGLVPKTKY
ncbi:hypothetical protein HXV90_06370 [Lysinibacillus sp. JK80]|uniref:hypothetical protein n=1 Tax=Lysinibacillus sp. JK80 TaxID=2749809 RepID=UPI0022B97D92|nr:hypothetical protein [Lysinibacillus sp. JK80]WBF55498.1 hypothetical protein HXV90_06370 [Lysinibacillus sp. JK80]